MAADPSIYSMLRPVPPQEGPLDQFGRMVSLKSMLGQNDLQDLQRQKAARDLQEEDAVRQIYAGATPEQMSAPDFLQRVMGASPARGIALQKAQLDNAKTRAEIESKQRESLAKGIQLVHDRLKTVTDDASYQAARDYEKQILGVDLAGRYGLPKDYNADFVRRSVVEGDKLFPPAHFVDSGSVVQPVDPYTGKPMGAAIPKTATPDAAARLDLEKVKADPFGILGINKKPTPAAVAGGDLSGDEYLQTLPPGVASQVKALASGKLQITPRTLQSPQGAALLQMAMQYEPGTDQTTYVSRAATAKDAANGKLATSNNALNTVSGHLASLADAAEKLSNTWSPQFNTLKNWIASSSGKPEVNTFNLNLMGVADELERAYRGAGGSAGEIENWKKTLGSSSSPEQFRGALAKGAEMLESKLHANQEQIDQGMRGANHGIRAITPEAQAALDKLRGRSAAVASPGAAPAPGAGAGPAAATTAAPQTFQNLPDPAQFSGRFMTDTTSGLRYQSDGKSWKRAPAAAAGR